MACSNNKCWIKSEEGMHTNSTCPCLRDLPTLDRLAMEKKIINARNLYSAVNEMMAAIGAYGELSNRDTVVTKVMDVLHSIDGGIPDKFAF